jgi:cytochrome P450
MDATSQQPKGPPPRRKGLISSLLYYRNFSADPFGFVKERFAKYGDIYRVDNTDGSALYVIRKPEHIREVLATKSAKYRKQHSAFERLSEILGDGLLTSDGDNWKRQRRLVQPGFHPDRLREYSTAMVEEAAAMAKVWSDGEVRDVSVDMMELTMRVVARTLFSHRVDEESEMVGRAMMQLQESFSSPTQFLPSWIPVPARTRAGKALADLDSVIYSLIAERRKENKSEKPTDLLQSLVDAVDEEGDGKGLSEKELRDQLMTLFLAGHETTSNALTWTLYLLSQNPGAYKKLRDEVDSVLAGRPVSFEDLESMPYGEQVIRESMRLYPPVAVMARKAHEDTEIGPYSVAAGSEVIAWLYLTHRDPSLYPNPEAFQPERFTAEEQAKRPKMAYLPFGGGPRLCVGHAFAMLEARLILATIMQSVDFNLVPGHRVIPKLQITLGSKHGMRMRIRRRKDKAS